MDSVLSGLQNRGGGGARHTPYAISHFPYFVLPGVAGPTTRPAPAPDPVPVPRISYLQSPALAAAGALGFWSTQQAQRLASGKALIGFALCY